jgi:EAL domain-containing protein (putative c-di-GMP-specific phosphodiesterase class I)
MAMYRNKRTRKTADMVYSRGISERCAKLLKMEQDLRQAQINGEFFLDYQPEVDIASGEIVGMEALVRWQHPKLGLVLPDQFIRVAEETGLIDMLGEWVLRTACAQNKAWQDAHFPPARISVNVSTSQVQSLKLTEMVRDILAETNLAPCWLELEINEDILTHHFNTTINTLKNLHDLGIRICIDNFGTGTTSLAAIRRFPVDALKIDRSFVSRITVSNEDAALARTIIAIAHNLGLSVTAEGVEDEVQLDYLRKLDCTSMQGYLFSRPLRADDCTAFFSGMQPERYRQVNGPPSTH